MKRNAFTMIELVFSIVIVGIVILSIPLIVRQSNANMMMSQNIIGYYNALSFMETIRTKPWDASNVSDYNASGEYYILTTGDSYQCEVIKEVGVAKNLGLIDADDLLVDDGNGKMVEKALTQDMYSEIIHTKKGLAHANKRRMCDPNGRSASGIAQNASFDSINTFNGHSINVQYVDESSNANNVFELKSAVSYAKVEFNNGTKEGHITSNVAGTTDVKEIKITLSRIDPNGGSEEVATFTYYAANIGTDIPLVKDNTATP